ncbi:MAG: hypothetical protein GXO62_00130 [Epsilonproteobacteria bacterium]|nr:hypothetical protein [Campylobacterota bacterium]
MAEIDKQKEKITFFRSVFLLILGSLFALIAFIFTNYNKLNQVQLFLANIVGFVLLVSILLLLKKIFEEINKLEDM